MPACAITSLAFMLLEVPEPVWNTSIGKCASCAPSATASAALRIAAACALRQQAEAGVDLGRRGLDQPSARMKPRGIGRPEIGKFSHRALGLRAPQRIGGHLQFAHAVVFDADIAAGLVRHLPCCPRGWSAASIRRRAFRIARPFAAPTAMSDAQLLALSPLDGRYAGKVDALRPIFSEYGLIQRARAGRGRMAAGAGRRAGHRRAARRSPPAPRRACARWPTTSRRRRRRAGQGDRAHHQPRRQGGRVLASRNSSKDDAELAPALRVRALRLHQRGHQQPQPRADAASAARDSVLLPALDALIADAARRWRTRTPRCRCCRAPTARPPRPTTRRQGNRQRRRAPAARSASVLAARADAGQDQRRGRQLQRARRRLSRRRLAGVRAALRRIARPGLATRTPPRSSRTTTSPSCSTRCARINTILHRPVPRHLGLHLARLLQADG